VIFTDSSSFTSDLAFRVAFCISSSGVFETVRFPGYSSFIFLAPGVDGIDVITDTSRLANLGESSSLKGSMSGKEDPPGELIDADSIRSKSRGVHHFEAVVFPDQIEIHFPARDGPYGKAR